MTTMYIQTRLRRELEDGSGYSNLVLWIPEVGTNGVKVEAGRVVHLKNDPDPRPWEIVAAAGPTQPEAYFQRKHGERRRREATIV